MISVLIVVTECSIVHFSESMIHELNFALLYSYNFLPYSFLPSIGRIYYEHKIIIGKEKCSLSIKWSQMFAAKIPYPSLFGFFVP